MNIYALVILPPGERKSSAKDTCRAPLLAWEREQEVLLAKEVRLAKVTQLVNEEVRRAISAKAKRNGTPEARLELAKQIAQTSDCSDMGSAGRASGCPASAGG